LKCAWIKSPSQMNGVWLSARPRSVGRSNTRRARKGAEIRSAEWNLGNRRCLRGFERVIRPATRRSGEGRDRDEGAQHRMGGFGRITGRASRLQEVGRGEGGRSDQHTRACDSEDSLSEPPLTRPTTARWPWIAVGPESTRTLTTDAVAWCQRVVRGVRPRADVRTGATTFAVRRRNETTARDQE
jgi:hypothetical protein